MAQMERIIGLCCLLFVRSIQIYRNFFVPFVNSIDLKTFQTSGKRKTKRRLNHQDSKLCQSCNYVKISFLFYFQFYLISLLIFDYFEENDST